MVIAINGRSMGLGNHPARLVAVVEAESTIDAPVDTFVCFLGDREVDVDACTDDRLRDLYLVCGCVENDPGAAAAFERIYGLEIRRVAHATVGDSGVEDLTQHVLTHLLVPGGASAPPRIGQYMGTGSLRAFVRIVASRLAIDARRARWTPALGTAESADQADEAQPEPIEQLQDAQALEHLGPALGDALLGLKPIERRALRMRFVLGFSAARTAQALNIHENSVSRIVARARQRILAQLQEVPEIPSTPGGLASLAAVLDVSVSRYLQSHPGVGGDDDA